MTEPAPAAVADPFSVPWWIDWLGGWAARHPRTCIRLGNWETRVLEERLRDIRIDRPIYICGLARSGSTVLLEILAQRPEVATHAYRDFPLVLTPYFWNWFLDRAQSKSVAVERAHGDGIAVTADSPEAMEEMVWMAFFRHLHRSGHSDVLSASVQAPAFEAFYANHLRKLLWLRGGSRYLAKGNYNLTRLEYLLKLFPDARFVIPVREPEAHIASLLRQQRRFCERHRADPRALRYMQRAGHFEFGLDRRAIDANDLDEADRIERAWESGREVEGLARLWASTHAYVAGRLQQQPALQQATLLVRHEQLCAQPAQTLRRLFEHCGLSVSAEALDAAAAGLRPPKVYEPILSDMDRELIRAICGDTAAYFGY